MFGEPLEGHHPASIAASEYCKITLVYLVVSMYGICISFAGAKVSPRQRRGRRTAVPVTKGLPAMHAGLLFARPLLHRRAGAARIRLLSLRVFVRLIFCESDRTERPRPQPPIFCQVPPALWFVLCLDRHPPAAPRPAGLPWVPPAARCPLP